MTLNLEAKKILLRKIPHGLFICGVRDEEKNEVNLEKYIASTLLLEDWLGLGLLP